MKITLSKEAIKELPSPDSKGLIRVTVALKLNEREGTADLVEINDSPMPPEADESKSEAENESPAGDANAASEMMPSPGDVEKSIYSDQ